MELFKAFLQKKVVPALVTTYASVLHKTCKIEITGVEKIQAYIDAQQPMLPCYWHQQMTFAIEFLRELCQQGVKASVLVSPSQDGDIGDAVLKKMGVG